MLDPPEQHSQEWLTYSQLAARLDTSLVAAAQMARRRKWPRRFRDSGYPKVTVVLPPVDFAKPAKNMRKASSLSLSDELVQAIQLVAEPLAEALERQEQATRTLQAALDAARLQTSETQLQLAKATYELERSASENAALRSKVDALQEQVASAHRKGRDRGMWQATAAARIEDLQHQLAAALQSKRRSWLLFKIGQRGS